jgi:uncharacterized protein YcfJ
MLTTKRAIFFGMVAGSVIGGLVPMLWGAGAFSMSSVVGSTVGGLAGIWAGWKISRNF